MKSISKNRLVFAERVLSVEVVSSTSTLVRYIFPRPAVCTLLSERLMRRVHERLNYTGDDTQVRKKMLNEIIHMFFFISKFEET